MNPKHYRAPAFLPIAREALENGADLAAQGAWQEAGGRDGTHAAGLRQAIR